MDANRNRDRPRTTEVVNAGEFVVEDEVDGSRRRYHFLCGRSTCSILHHSERAARSDLGWLFPKLVIGPCIRIDQVLPGCVPSGPVGETSF